MDPASDMGGSGAPRAKKTVLVRRRVEAAAGAAASLPAGALTPQQVRERVEAAAAAAALAQAQQLQAEEEQRQAEREQMRQQRQLLQQQSQPLSPNRRALLMRRVPAAAPTADASAPGSGAGLGSSLPQSLALAAACGTGPGSAGWAGPPRDQRTGAISQWEVVGSTRQFEQAERERMRQMRAAQGEIDDEENEERELARQLAEEEEEEQSALLAQSHTGAPASRSSRLAQQLSAELAMARRMEAAEAAGANSRHPRNGQQFEQQLMAGQETRILAAHARTQASWASFKARTAAQLRVPESSLNISRSDEYRARLEEADLLDKARPVDEKGAGREEHWAGSLRSIGHTYIPIGNMFTGLFTRVQADPNPKIEVIRRTNHSGGGDSNASQRGLSQIAAPHHSKTWQHSEFLASRRALQKKHIGTMVSNQIVAAERAQIERGLPAGDVALLDDLHVRGQDMFQLEEVSEAEWYAARMADDADAQDTNGGAEEQSAEEARARARSAAAARKRAKKAAAATPFGAPVQGPSLVASTARLFFPLQHGPALSPCATAAESPLASTGAHVLPGENDRVSRIVRLSNNGTTAVQFRWRKLEGVLEQQAARNPDDADAQAERGDTIPTVPTASASRSDSFFFASAPDGTLLPGESIEVTFTFLPQVGAGRAQQTGAFLQRLRLETVPAMPRHHALTEWHALRMQQRRDVDENDENGAAETLPSLVLSGVNSALDTSSVIRAHLHQSLVAWKDKHLTALQLHKTLQAVPTPPPPPHLHREIFYNRNRPDKLFYYAELMPQWHALARDVFDSHKRQLRDTLVWDYSARMIAEWIQRVPARNADRVDGLQRRYDELVERCAVRPPPHPTRYEVCYGLVSSIAAQIPRLSNALQLQLGISEPLEQDLRKAAAEKQRRADEEAKAKLPFHLRGGDSKLNMSSLTAEQRRMREEEAARKAEADAVQAADDAAKLAERAALTAQHSSALESQVRRQIIDAFAYFDFLAAPQNTNLDPQALHPEEATRAAIDAARQAIEAGETPLHVSVLQQRHASLTVDPAPATGKATNRPRSGSRREVGSAASGAAGIKSPSGADSKSSRFRDALAQAASDAPESPRPLVLDEADEEQALLASALASPRLLSPPELEALRARSLGSFLALERARAATFDTRLVRSRVVYFGNGYSTPDTGVHIPTAAELRVKEERERMARYGQVVGRAEREAEERRQRDMHPMAALAQRQVLLVAASAIFSMVYTRERGIYAWAAQDAPDPNDEPMPIAMAVESAKKKTVTIAPSAPGKGLISNKTRLQEARRNILGFHLIPTTAAGSAAGGLVGSVAGAGAGASAAGRKDDKAGASKGQKASPRGSGSGAMPGSASKDGRSSSNKKSAASESSRPSSGSTSVRSTSPAPGGATAGPHVSLLPLMATGQTPLGALSQSGSAPLPCYIPELQGLELAAMSAGVHVAFLLTSSGALLAWEHATRRVHTLIGAAFPGEKELQQHQWSEKAVRMQLARDRAESADAAISGGFTARPHSRGVSPVPNLRKAGGGSSMESARGRTATASGAAPTASDKKSSRKVGTASSSLKKKGGTAHDEAEVLSVDSAAYELEQERLARLSRDADLSTAGKHIVSVVIGGSGTLSAGVQYAPLAPAPDFEFALLLTADGCVYSSLVTPPATAHPPAEAPSGSKAASATAKSAAKDSEKGTAMLGLGDKSKEALKLDKDKEKDATTAHSLVHFELLHSLHPANLSAAGAEVRVVQISAGYGHATALCSDGSVYVWGNEGPQLAQGEKDKKPRSLPTLLPSLQNITLPLLTPAASNGMAGDVKTLEVGAVTAATTMASPAATTKSASVPAIRVGGHSRSGSNGLGSGRKGAASAGKKGAVTDVQSVVESALGGGVGGGGPIDPVVSVVCGAFHCVALTASGGVVSWGRGADGALGHGDNRDREVPTLIAALSPSHEPALLAAALAAANAPVVKAPAHGATQGRFASHASSSAAAAAAAAAGSAPSISLGQSSGGPPPLSPFLQVVGVAAGGAHTLVRAVPLPSAVRRDEHGTETPLAAPTVLSFGLGAAGATGLGVCDDTNAPHSVGLFSGARVLQLAAGGDCSLAVVQREAGPAAVALVADEDDMPNAVLEDLI